MSAAPIHIRHPELDGTTEYWHDQRLISAQARWRAVYGLSEAFALVTTVPFRLVRDRIRYETPAGAPYTPADPDRHHRNETVSGLGDPSLALQYGHASAGGSWTLAAGLMLPAGRTEDNPFALGRDGQRHQHTQIGAGVASPLLSASFARPIGAWRTSLTADVLLPFETNVRGYRPGSRLGGGLTAARHVAGRWSAAVGADLSRENAERWDGRIEEEGNVGRSDLFLRASLTSALTSPWSLGVTVQVPVWSDIEGAQADLPFVIGLALSH